MMLARLRAVACALAATSLLAALPVSAAEPAAGSSRELQADALRSLPMAKLTPQGRELATKIINDTTIFRRLPQQVIEADPELYRFLVENPEMVINMWEVMGVTKVTIKKLGPSSYRIDDGQGTSGDIHFLYRSSSHHVMYCEGVYTGTMMPRPVRGRCILSLRSAHVRDADDRSYVQCRLDSFVQLDNIGIEIFAKTFQTMLGGIADHNFRETTGFVQSVSAAAEAAPENLHRIASKCRNVQPEIKQQFTDISDRIYRDIMGYTATGTPTPAISTARRQTTTAPQK
ncbi:MAG: hypothetical protein QM775_02995 [Pirellulales bacterium]